MRDNLYFEIFLLDREFWSGRDWYAGKFVKPHPSGITYRPGRGVKNVFNH